MHAKLYLLYCIIIIMQVGIDLIGPLPTTKNNNKYVVTLVDYFSKWPEAAPLPDKTAAGVAMFLYELFCRRVNYRVCFMNRTVISQCSIYIPKIWLL